MFVCVSNCLKRSSRVQQTPHCLSANSTDSTSTNNNNNTPHIMDLQTGFVQEGFETSRRKQTTIDINNRAKNLILVCINKPENILALEQQVLRKKKEAPCCTKHFITQITDLVTLFKVPYIHSFYF